MISNRILFGLGFAVATLLWVSGLFSFWVLSIATAVAIISFLAVQLTPSFTRPILIATGVIILIAFGVGAIRTSLFTSEDDRLSYLALGNSQLEADMEWAERIDPHARELRGLLATKCRKTEAEVTEQINGRMRAAAASDFLRPAEVRRVQREITHLQRFRAKCSEAVRQSGTSSMFSTVIAYVSTWPAMLVFTGIAFLMWWFLPRGRSTAGIAMLAGLALLILLVMQGWEHLPSYWKDALGRRGTTASLYGVTAVDSPTAHARDIIRERCDAALKEKTEVLKGAYPTLSDEAALKKAGEELAKIESFGKMCGALVAPPTSLPSVAPLAESMPGLSIVPIAFATGLVLLLLLVALWGKGGAVGTIVSVLLIVGAFGLALYYSGMKIGGAEIAMLETGRPLDVGELERTASRTYPRQVVPVSFRMAPHSTSGEINLVRMRLVLRKAEVRSDRYKLVAYKTGVPQPLQNSESHSLPRETEQMSVNNDSDHPAEVTLIFEKY